MTKAIVYHQENGLLAIVTPAPGLDIEDITIDVPSRIANGYLLSRTIKFHQGERVAGWTKYTVGNLVSVKFGFESDSYSYSEDFKCEPIDYWIIDKTNIPQDGTYRNRWFYDPVEEKIKIADKDFDKLENGTFVPDDII